MFSRPFSELLLEFIVQVFIILPAPLLVIFAVCLILFLTAPKGSEKRQKRKTWFIVISVFCAVLFLIWFAIMAFFVLALSHM